MSGSTSITPKQRTAGTIARRSVLTGAAATIAAAGTAGRAAAQPTHHRPGGHRATDWVGSWAASPSAVPATALTRLQDQTIRNVVKLSLGGPALRIRLSNEFGDAALRVGEVRVARRAGSTGTDSRPATDRPVRFGGSASVLIPAGAPAVSDPVDLDLPDGAELVISIYLPERTPISSVHSYALQENAIAAGNVTSDRSLTPTDRPQQWWLLSEISVRTRSEPASIIALGDSITDGGKSTVGANHRWPDELAKRLRSDRRGEDLGVINAGISGNRLLFDPNPPAGSDAEAFALYFGPSALRRFDRDVLAQPGASFLITLLGVNDLGHPGTVAPVSETVTADEIIAGHRQLISRAHDAGLKAFGGTIMPFKDDTLGFWNETNGAKRNAVNAWIRSSGEYDAVIDFAEATADRSDPDRLASRYDSGDGLHPNDAGCAAMAAAVPLKLFR